MKFPITKTLVVVLIVGALYLSNIPQGIWLARNVYVQNAENARLKAATANLTAEIDRLKKELAAKGGG